MNLYNVIPQNVSEDLLVVILYAILKRDKEIDTVYLLDILTKKNINLVIDPNDKRKLKPSIYNKLRKLEPNIRKERRLMVID